MLAAPRQLRRIPLFSIAGVLLIAAGGAAVQFVDVTAEVNIDYTTEHSPTASKYLPETMGGGVALLDYNNDGRLDILFVNGARIDDPMPPGKAPDKSDRRYWNRFYRQNEDGTFTDVTEKTGLTGMPQNRYGMGAAVGDYDNDGFEDIYVTNYGANTLYHNNGDGTFTDVTARAGVAGSGWSTSAGFFDYNNDGRLDLFVARYMVWDFSDNRFCGERKPGGRAYCHPDNYPGITNVLYRNNGDGTFTDVSERAGVANPEGKSLGVGFADFDGDGWTDIFVANDAVQCFLYHNKGDGTFEDVSLTAGAGYNEDGKTFAGMGIDFADYNNDGRPDIAITDLSDQKYVLYKNIGDGSFMDVTNESGIGRATLTYSGWSMRFMDYDNDGWKDLFIAQSHVMDNIEVTSPNLRYMQAPLLLRNIAGRFAEVDGGPGMKVPRAGRGAAFGDIDNDGDIDVVVANLGQKAYVLRNEGGNRNGWIRVHVRGVKSNRDGIGSEVKVVSASGLTQYYTVKTAVGYLSASDKRLAIGLGADKVAKTVEVRWPGGGTVRYENVPAGKVIEASEPVQ